MSPRLLAQIIAAGRVAIGAGLLVKPELITTSWVGPADGTRPGVKLLGGGLGARDMVIGAGVLAGIRGGNAKPWLLGSALADSADLVSTLRNGKELPKAALAGTVAVAGGAAAVGFWLLTQDV
jgi:hypothetical protein